MTFGPPPKLAVEGGVPFKYIVSLDAEPCDDVRIDILSDSQSRRFPAQLVFTQENWNEPQIVAISALHDFVEEGSHKGSITNSISSSDPRFSGLPDVTLTFPIQDRAHLQHISVALTGPSSNQSSTAPVVSDNGSLVAFTSSASNLVLGDGAAKKDIFLRDTNLQFTQNATAGGNGDSSKPQLSSDGSVLAFFSFASNLNLDTTSNQGEVFRFDNGIITKVSPACNPACNEAISDSRVGLSADGSHTVFSTRRNLIQDFDGEYDIYLAAPAQDLQQVSLNSEGENGANFVGSNAFEERISATGRYVGFRSTAKNLAVPEIVFPFFHAYVKDMQSALLLRVSSHNGSDDPCEFPASSVSSPATSPAISADGNLAAFSNSCNFLISNGMDDNAASDVFLRNIAAQTTTKLSVSSAGIPGNRGSTFLGMSDDGTKVLFSSLADNLVAGDTNARLDLFVHNTLTATTTRVSYGNTYEELALGISETNSPASISRDGKFVVFATRSKLLETDTNNFDDIYLVQLEP